LINLYGVQILLRWVLIRLIIFGLLHFGYFFWSLYLQLLRIFIIKWKWRLDESIRLFLYFLNFLFFDYFYFYCHLGLFFTFYVLSYASTWLNLLFLMLIFCNNICLSCWFEIEGGPDLFSFSLFITLFYSLIQLIWL